MEGICICSIINIFLITSRNPDITGEVMNQDENDYTINYSINISSDTVDRPISDNPAENIIIVGTAHVSTKSVTEVEETIDRERPDVVAVELCPARYQALTEKVETKKISAKDILSGGKPYYFLVHWLMAYVQKNMSIWEKLKMTGAMLTAALGFKGEELDIESVTEEDVVTQLIEELRKFAPSAARVFIDERDAYISANLLDAAKSSRVVAVVGAGHREGIQRYLEHPDTLPPMEQLIDVPKKRFSITKIVGLTFVALAFATFLLVILGIIEGAISPYMLLVAMGYWFIINGVLSAAGAALARGHPKSIATAFLVAWLTSLNPMMAAGWFAGLMEAKQRTPTTDDFRSIMDAETVQDMLNNRLFRVLLVAALANLGSVLGTIIGIIVIVNVTGINPTETLENIFNNYF